MDQKEINELYERFSYSKVVLEEENHIYIENREEGHVFYNSMTGALELIKNKFRETEVLRGLSVQYRNFYNWYFKIVYAPKDRFLRALELYVNYKNFRESTGIGVFQGREYLKYKKIQEYTIDEFFQEFEYLEQTNTVKRKKNIYVINDEHGEFCLMKKEEMKEMWTYMTDIANHYGNIVHIVNERLLLKLQGIVFDDIFYTQMLNHWLSIKKILSEVKIKYPHSPHSFAEYYIPFENLNLFIAYLEDRFMQVKFDRGRVIVPEKRVLYKNLAGTTDVYIDLSDKYFNIGDHKTNKKYTFHSEYDQYLKPPFDRYDECEHNLYTFQANGYAWMIEQTSKKIMKKLWITYFDRKKMDYIKYDIPKKYDEAEYIITNYFNWIDSLKKAYFDSSLGNFIKDHISEGQMDYFIKKLHTDIMSKKEKGIMDEDKDKWRKHYMQYILAEKDKYKKITNNIIFG